MIHTIQTIILVMIDFILVPLVCMMVWEIFRSYRAVTLEDRIRRAYKRNDEYMASMGMMPNERTIARRGVK